MKACVKILFLSALLTFYSINAQTVSGNIINQNGDGIAGAQMLLYTNQKAFSTVSIWDGSFCFSNLTNVKREQLPSGYSVSSNYPNPFNPKTRIEFTIPTPSNLTVEVFNPLGQKVQSDIKKHVNAGNSFVDLELNGLANGVYIARLSFDEKFFISRKLMLLYGSQHLTSSYGITGKRAEETFRKQNSFSEFKIDSIVVRGNGIYKKAFFNLPPFSSAELNIGNLNMITPCPESPKIEYEGRTYNTVKIGPYCWLKENLNAGKMILVNSIPSDTNSVEKYCYDNDTANCEKYGGLYTWREATKHVPSSSINDICPTGWHLPSYIEFSSFISFTKNDGNKLKREDQGIGDWKGTNETGFSGLLTGCTVDNFGYFSGLNKFGYYWAKDSYNTYRAYSLGLFSENNSIYLDLNNMNYGFPVRCVKNDESINSIPQRPTLNLPINQSKNLAVPLRLVWFQNPGEVTYTLQISEDSAFSKLVYNQNNIKNYFVELGSLSSPAKYYWRVSATNSYGTSGFSDARVFYTSSVTDKSCPGIPTVIDNRDGFTKIYNTVKIGNLCWLKENLDVGVMLYDTIAQTNNSIIEKYCFNNDTENCRIYGGLYQWNEAMQYVNTERAQGICPEGWKIPTYAVMRDSLAEVVNNQSVPLLEYGQGVYPAIGTNESGFSALLYDFTIYFWTSSQYQDLSNAMSFWNLKNYITFPVRERGSKFSLRCYKSLN